MFSAKFRRLAAASAPRDTPRALCRSRSITWLFNQFPWLSDFIYLCLGIGIIALLYRILRPARSASGFTIDVDEDDIEFNGNFPPHMEAFIAEFLQNDCPITGPYQIRGHWEEQLLIVVVKGDGVGPYEQRIRNFLKLNLKASRA